MSTLTLKDKEVVLVALEEAQEFDDTGVVDTPHNLHLFENIRALESARTISLRSL